MSETLVVNEIYLSVQGESTFTGWPCIFIRLTACDLRCSYCDTAYAFTEGHRLPLEAILAEVDRLSRPFPPSHQRLPLVELTGGEPLLQEASLTLMKQLCDQGSTVLLETSGAHDIKEVDPRVHRIVDIKCPSSGEAQRNRWENLRLLQATDEVKFVIASIEDYEWARQILHHHHHLLEACPALFSWAAPLQTTQRDASLKPFPNAYTPISQRDLVERIIADSLPVRFQAQLHKLVWAPDQRGV